MVEPSGRRRGAEAFDEFYASHVDKVYRALAVAVGSDDLAREATDEAMTRAYAHWARVSGLDNPGGWVFRVGLNWATSWWRKTRRERTRLGDVPQLGSPGPDPVALAARAAVDRLPVSQRSVVVCRVLLGLSTVETAAVLQLAEGTVKSRLSRARAALREALEG